jgi:hypothetical protein
MYRIIQEDNLIKKGGNGVENPRVDPIGDQQ